MYSTTSSKKLQKCYQSTLQHITDIPCQYHALLLNYTGPQVPSFLWVSGCLPPKLDN